MQPTWNLRKHINLFKISGFWFTQRYSPEQQHQTLITAYCCVPYDKQTIYTPCTVVCDIKFNVNYGNILFSLTGCRLTYFILVSHDCSVSKATGNGLESLIFCRSNVYLRYNFQISCGVLPPTNPMITGVRPLEREPGQSPPSRTQEVLPTGFLHAFGIETNYVLCIYWTKGEMSTVLLQRKRRTVSILLSAFVIRKRGLLIRYVLLNVRE
jgi:hypothetical protein